MKVTTLYYGCVVDGYIHVTLNYWKWQVCTSVVSNEVNTLAQVNDTMHCKFHTDVSSASLFHSEHILSVTTSLTKMQNQKFESLKYTPIYNDENHSLHIIIHIHMYICISYIHIHNISYILSL